LWLKRVADKYYKNIVVLTALYSFILKGTQRDNKVTGS